MEANKKEFNKEKETTQNNIIESEEDLISQLNINLEKIKNNLKKYDDNYYNKEFVILIESGSLAPPHKMHLGIMELTKKYFEQDKTKNREVICGFLVPSSDNYVMGKLKNDFIPLSHRINMTKLMIKNSNWLECLDWGFSSGGRIRRYIDIIIKKEFPDYNIKSYLVFGIDYYLKYKVKVIGQDVCIYRPGYDINTVKNLYPKNLIFIEGSNDDVSSTLIRNAIRLKDEKTISQMTSKEIIDYNKKNDIFTNDK
jgi:nicotinic acid mononucleotide adenylyltransferase